MRYALGAFLGFTLRCASAETADDFFHEGAVHYLSNNIPKALEVVTRGRELFPNDVKLMKLEELLRRQAPQQQQGEQQTRQDQQRDQSEQQQDQKQLQSASSQAKDGGREQRERQEAGATRPTEITPELARQMLDALRAEEAMMPLGPERPREQPQRAFKDW
ncbi:MAG: hypothetical protein NZ739_00445 [Verrucomicrobiae bacterium]|nr:hypothetical protein [Verrucomicrobiae bacterium]MCX7722055.1 hypothetical protein [Verrucomicrobiae bacterium]MDW7979173.1 hypothetical protein [Verrucomicrobiales bacterium]